MAELYQLNEQVAADPENFELWEKLVAESEAQEGGLSRNSSPQAIAATRDTYDRFLARFPLFFGYWKKYADLEFAIGGTEAAEMVYERGVASIGISVDLWANYCAFKVETSHDADVIRELFDRAAESVGLDFLAHPFWDKYIEFEERLEAHDRIFAILDRIIHIPLHQYARYFERYQTMAAQRPLSDIAPEEVITRLRDEIAQDTALKSKEPAAVDKELRSKISAYHMEIFARTQTETTKRWTYEQEVKRPYYHVTELDDAQLANWRKYLDFEETEGDYARTKFLYERCLVTCANYDEFWYRYARWTMGQAEKSKVILDEEVRNIYRRASCTYVSITQPEVRLHYARFEESLGKADTAIAIHEAILQHLPSHLETIVSLANTHRRQFGLQPAIDVLKSHISNSSLTPVRGSLIVEQARLFWKVKGNADEARNIFKSSRQPDSKAFWAGWLDFEISQPTSEKTETAAYERIKAVYQDIRKSLLRPKDIRELATRYLSYLEGRAGKEAMAEWTEIDKEINGPISIANTSGVTSKATLENGLKGR